jgi:hypothetical protein
VRDRRIGLLHRLGPGYHLRKIDHVVVILGLGLGPDLLYPLDPLAHQFEAGFELGAVVLHFILVPAAADTKQKAAVRHLIDRGRRAWPSGSGRPAAPGPEATKRDIMTDLLEFASCSTS